MSDTLPVSTTQSGEAPGGLRVAGLMAVCVGLAALAAAAFVLSYSGIHAIALQAGISPRLARGYPLLLDAMLVVVLAAVLSLRGAGVLSKVLSWLTLLTLLGAAAGADALHAAREKLPVRAAEITAAVLPWVLVFLAFVLLLAMLGHARVRRLDAVQASIAAGDATRPSVEEPAAWGLTRQPATAGDIVPGFRTLPGQARSQPPDYTAQASTAAGKELTADADSQSTASTSRERSMPPVRAAVRRPKLTVPRQRRPNPAGNAEADVSAVQPGATGSDQDVQALDAELAIDAQLTPDDPSSDETALAPVQPEAVQPEPAEDTLPEPAGSDRSNDAPAEVGVSGSGADENAPFGTLSPAPTEAAESPDPDMPVFHRISSSPVPPNDM